MICLDDTYECLETEKLNFYEQQTISKSAIVKIIVSLEHSQLIYISTESSPWVYSFFNFL